MDVLETYRSHLLAVFRTPCTCDDDTCAACIAEHGLYLSPHPDAAALTDEDLGHVAGYEDGFRFQCADCPSPAATR